MTSPTVTREARPRPGAALTALSLPSRAMSFFSGPVGFGVKLAFLAVTNAIALWAAIVLLADEKWAALAVLVVATAAIDAVYLAPRRTLPAKFLLPGTIFLLAFQVLPVAYTVRVAFTNYSTGHVLSKAEAIEAIEERTLTETPESKAYTMAPARDEDGELVLVLVDEESGKPFVGTRDGLEPLPEEAVKVSPEGLVTSAEGYRLISGSQLATIDKELEGFIVPTEGDAAIRPEGLDVALELTPSLRYDPRRDVFVGIEDGKVYRDNGRGSFVSEDGVAQEPGWTTGVGAENFRRVLDEPLIRDPFIRVFAWTMVFAVLTVFISFAIGLFLAITLQKKIPLQKLYRTVLAIPYAIPSFLTILVWAGLLNDDFGVVNRLLHLDVPWLFDGGWARVSVILVSVWLTFPYFFLVSLGALQSIPGELVEAARVDGAGPGQVFRKITLPLLLVAVAPLLIASFAFNFNNFNSIFLLTQGGPQSGDQSIAGATDILISYTYKLAFESGKGQDYALASTISIFIFFIVATISALAFWRSRSLENVT